MNTSFIDSFNSPGREYGEVPFYWWTGDKLDKTRLEKQLTALAEKGVAGVQINYAHQLRGGEAGEQYGGHGKSIPGAPVQFSEDWWEMFRFAAEVCERLGMGIGVGDYTLAWIGNGFFTDTIAADTDMNALEMSCEKKMLFTGDEELFGEDVLCAVTYKTPACDDPVIIYEKDKGVLSPVPGCAEAYIVTLKRVPFSIDPLAPGCGDRLVDIYFKEFERRCPELKKGTLNYFFQDELMFGCSERLLWRDTLKNGVTKKYGYDLTGFLPHLFFDLGDITPKIRLDVSDVRTALFEENYFKPVYHFHSSRGMIYGCDQSGRGKQPDEFSDYFRTVRWFTAPGNDTPGRAADMIKVKVNSSIAHLYKRPRVWLEGYHSSGWGTTLESITAPTSDNFIFGANLLNLHGLYYSTNGGFFEWAPPDFHFRMPYWDDEEVWLNKYKRLAALLTTGVHRCDVCIYYPVSSCEYGPNAEKCIDTTFSAAQKLFAKGIDFDFIDFQSVERAKCENGKLKVSDEEYKVFLIAGTDCIRYSVIKKLKELLDCGGTVIFLGITPYASDRAGAHDPVLQNDISDIIMHSHSRLAMTADEVISFITMGTQRSFLPETVSADGKAYVCRRVSGKDELYFTRYIEKDTVCRFEAEGTPYLLDTYSGKIFRLEGALTAQGHTLLRMPNEAEEDTVLLFTDEFVDYDDIIDLSEFENDVLIRTADLNSDWDFSLVPTLDNTYGDFYLPAGGMIGAQARFFDCAAEDGTAYADLPFCTELAIKRIYTEDVIRTAEKCAASSFSSKSAETPELHSRYGYISRVDGDTSNYEQGYHGLKGRVYDDNMYFSADSVFYADIFSECDCSAYLYLTGYPAEIIYINGEKITDRSSAIRLHKGINRLSAGFIYNRDSSPDYRNSGEIKRAGIYLAKEREVGKTGIPLAKCDFANPGFFRFVSTVSRVFTYRFTAPPALTGFTAGIFGKIISASADGIPMTVSPAGKGEFGCELYSVKTSVNRERTAEIVFTAEVYPGYEFTSAIPQPVDLECGDFGKVDCGDLSKLGALKCYSGKAVYHKKVSLERINTDERFFIDLGKVGASARVEINGKTAAVFTFAPFRTEITEYVINGENDITVTVSNTLCNHYSTVPSKYSNFPTDAASGLIGPAKIEIFRTSDN